MLLTLLEGLKSPLMWWLKWEIFQHQMTNRALPYISRCSESNVLKDIGHLRNWHCQHCHRGDPCDLSEPQWEVSCTQFRTDFLIILLARTVNSPWGDTWHQERTGEIILTTVKHSLVHNLPTDTSSTLAHNTLKPESKHSYLYLMSRVTKTNYFWILDPQRG